MSAPARCEMPNTAQSEARERAKTAIPMPSSYLNLQAHTAGDAEAGALIQRLRTLPEAEALRCYAGCPHTGNGSCAGT